jgi:glycosyltransferase involved in cell wall biosynthesis
LVRLKFVVNHFSHPSNLYLAGQKFIILFYLEITFFAAASIQIIYFLLFLISFVRYKKSATPSTEVVPVSIIVCAHDELHNLQELVPLLLTQDYAKFEVVVVDDRSNDETLDWLMAETKKDERLRMVHVNRAPDHVNGKKYGLTLGIRAAAHEWLVFTDADCRPASTHWLKELSVTFDEDKKFVLGYSPYVKQAGWLNLFIRFETLITALQYMGFALWKIPYMGVGRNLAYRKSLFMEIKGFNTILSITGGDDDLFVNQHANENNTTVVLGADALVYSLPKTTVEDFWNQKVRHLAAGKRYKLKHRLLLGLFMASWLLTLWLGFPLLFLSNVVLAIGGVLLFRVIMATISLHIAGRRMGSILEFWAFAVLDIIYSIYYLTTGTAALVTKRIRWKK